MYKIHLRKKRLESYLPNMYVLNLLKEPQRLAKIRTSKLLKNSKKRGNKSTRRKLKNNCLRLREEKQKVHGKCPRQFPNVKVRILWRDWFIWEIMYVACVYKNNTKGGEEEKNWNLKTTQTAWGAGKRGRPRGDYF